MNAAMIRFVAGCFLLTGLGAAPIASAQLTWADVLFFAAPPESPVYANQMVAKTRADECFDGIGVDYPPINPDGSCDQGIPKKNLAYVWGMAQAGLGDASFTGDEIWFGTIANPVCEGAAGIFDPEPQLTVSWVCEFGQSELARRPVFPLPPAAGDWRLPRAYSYNAKTKTLTERTPRDLNFYLIAGLRSAGSLGSAVFMAGPTFQQDVTFAAWNAATGAYGGSCRATALNNIRQWITVNGTLYAAAGRDAGDGVILRWRGSVGDPFNGAANVSDYCGFEVVGVMPGFPAYVASYNAERLAVSVWSKNRRTSQRMRPGESRQADNFQAGVYVGPPFGPDGGYTSDDASASWAKIWGPTEYETDPVIASTTGGGAITYWRGYLWFGTMHNTLGTLEAHTTCTLPVCFGPPASQEEQISLLFNVSRAVSIWRAQLNETGGADVELLYGESALPALVPRTKTFEMRPTGWTPLFGKSGFDNPFLTYTWSALSGDDDLLIGTYDYRYIFDVRLGIVSDASGRPGLPMSKSMEHGPARLVDEVRGYGGDLWRFDDVDNPAQGESVHGLGNFANYGVRTMLRFDGGPDVFLGTANGLNLEPDGGWELHFLTGPAR